MFLTSSAATDGAVDIGSIKQLLDGIDPAALLPEIDSVVGITRTVCRIAVMAAPLVLLVMGLAYLLFAPKEANYYFGYRTTFGMGSVSAWRHTQRVAGYVFSGLGLLLSIIMLMVIFTMGGMEAMDMVWLAAKCLLWEAVLSVIAVLSINSVAAATFDFKGKRRRK